MPTTQLEAHPVEPKTETQERPKLEPSQEPSPRSVAYAVEHMKPEDEEDPLTAHLTVLLVPAAIAGLFLVTAQSAPYYAILTLVCYAAIGLLAIGQAVKTKTSWTTLTVSTGIAGGVATFIFALYELVATKEIVLLFGVLTKPLFTALILGLCTGFVYQLLLLVLKYRERKQTS